MRLFVVRHGQSTANLEQRHSGWAQVPLTDKGREDGRRAGEVLRGLSFDRVYCSDLIRAMETMELARPEDAPRAEILKQLRERSVGELSGRLVSDCYENLGEAYLNARQNRDFTAFGGESFEKHCARLTEFLRILEENPCERALAFSHAGSIDCLLYLTTGMAKHESGRSCTNGSVSVFRYENGCWSNEVWAVTDPADLDSLR